ncbi:MAG: type II secretion system secretin GspD [Actinomycetota bacterium]
MPFRFLLLAVLVLLASCAPPAPAPEWEALTRAAAPPADAPVAEAQPVAAPPDPRREAVLMPGSGRFARPRPVAEARTTEAGDITFSFVDADVRAVLKAVLGDILGRRYVVSTKVQGTVTVQTGQPLSRDAAFATLETVLRMSGIAMVEVDGTVKVVPYDEAPRVGGEARLLPAPDERPAGYGVEVVPLAYASAGEIKKMLEPMAPPGAVLQADDARNILVFSGTGPERKSMREMVDIFDVDWLKGMSFALIPLANADAKAVATELTGVFGEGASGPMKNMMRFSPVERLNSVLAIATNPDYLGQARRWVENFDRAGDAVGGGRRLYVYPVQNGRAADLALVLDGLFGSGSSVAAASASVGAGGGLRQRQKLGSATPGGGGGGIANPLAAAKDPAPLGGEPAATATAAVLEKGARIVADDGNNALVALATAEEWASIEQALKRLDIVPLQVLVDATIAEVTLNDQLRYGLQWFFRKGDFSSTFSSLASGSVASLFPGFSFALQGTDARVILNALSSVTNVNVVSAPTLLVLTNQTAQLQVGDQVPVATQQARSVIDPQAPIVNTIQFRDTGVILRVTPRVNAGGLVFLDIEQEVSDVAQTTSSNIDSPTIRQRRIASTVAVQSGETIALGGLIRDTRTRGKDGLPILGDIPVMGPLFATNNDQASRTELLVLLSPRVVRSRDDARGATDELRRRLKGLRPPSEGKRE